MTCQSDFTKPAITRSDQWFFGGLFLPEMIGEEVESDRLCLGILEENCTIPPKSEASITSKLLKLRNF